MRVHAMLKRQGAFLHSKKCDNDYDNAQNKSD